MFFGNFTSKSDVCNSFGIDNFKGTIIYAVYDNENYSGEATVIFVENGKFYHVHASHCSCYGLEGNGESLWIPEEMPIKVLMRMVQEGNGAVMHQHRDALAKALEIVSDLDLENASEDVVTVTAHLAFG